MRFLRVVRIPSRTLRRGSQRSKHPAKQLETGSAGRSRRCSAGLCVVGSHGIRKDQLGELGRSCLHVRTAIENGERQVNGRRTKHRFGERDCEGAARLAARGCSKVRGG